MNGSAAFAEASESARGPDDVTVVTPTLGSCAVQAGGLLGLEFCPITVEVSSRRGPSNFQMAGLAETAVREARIRINSALSLLGITLEEYALTVNLAPAHLRKGGTGLDLAIAVGILGAIGRIDPDRASGALFIGEVSLGGQVRPVPGVLPLILGASRLGCTEAFVAEANAQEAVESQGLVVRAVRDLGQLLEHWEGARTIAPASATSRGGESPRAPELGEVRGQHAAKRALTVAAAGGHHILLIGPPGSGKSLLARRLPGLLPPLSREEAVETSSIHSVAGLLRPGQGVLSERPFRAPHHTVSEAGLVGGGSYPRPGELSLAHNGVLFLDELPEFRRGTLEALRQPLEEHEVHIVRSKMRATFPARPLLVVGAMNPCPCGNFGSPHMVCRCTAALRKRYSSRISGPLLDRLDLHVVVPPADLRSWQVPRDAPELTSAAACKVVSAARAIQLDRAQSKRVSATHNSLLTIAELERIARPTAAGQKLLDKAIDKRLLSARGYVRVLRVARTLADLDEAERPGPAHIGEALRYRISDLAAI